MSAARLASSAAPKVLLGCAGWSLSKDAKPFFPEEGTHLERYARVFSAVEINSSFYRPHKPETYARWAASVPEGFRFAVKVPRTITHELRLRAATGPLERFLAEVGELGERLGALLVQLPASAALEEATAEKFLAAFRKRFAGRIAWEARHPSWFTPPAFALLRRHEAASVAADPAVAPEAGEPGGFDGFAYFRLHGSTRLYYSEYPETFLRVLAERLRAVKGEAFCIFDNTAAGAAVPNALRVRELLGEA